MLLTVVPAFGKQLLGSTPAEPAHDWDCNLLLDTARPHSDHSLFFSGRAEQADACTRRRATDVSTVRGSRGDSDGAASTLLFTRIKLLTVGRFRVLKVRCNRDGFRDARATLELDERQSRSGMIASWRHRQVSLATLDCHGA